jgi:hypothetical protein
MKLIIAGTRTIDVSTDLIKNLLSSFRIYPFSENRLSEIVSGECRSGADDAAKRFAHENYIPYKAFPADWVKLGKSAGPLRNKEMADYADALLLIWDGSSNGSFSIRREMKFRKKKVYEIIVKEN